MNMDRASSLFSDVELRPTLVWNSVVNHHRIAEWGMSGKSICATTIPHADRSVPNPAVVIGSGPSLDEAAPLLERFPGTVFACPSQSKILDRWGRLPDYVVAVDTHPIVSEQLKGPLWSDTCLITHQAIDPSVLEMWKWRLRFVRMKIGDDDRDQETMYPWLKMPFSGHGSTPNSAVQLAHWLGYSPIFLVGMDLGFPDGKERAQQWEQCGSRRYRPVAIERTNNRRAIETGQGLIEECRIMTTAEMLYYKLSLLAIWGSVHARLISCSRGTLTELPWHEFAEVCESDFDFSRYPMRDDEIDDAVRKRLEPAGWRIAGGMIEKAELFAQREEGLEQELEAVRRVLAGWTREGEGWRRE